MPNNKYTCIGCHKLHDEYHIDTITCECGARLCKDSRYDNDLYCDALIEKNDDDVMRCSSCFYKKLSHYRKLIVKIALDEDVDENDIIYMFKVYQNS